VINKSKYRDLIPKDSLVMVLLGKVAGGSVSTSENQATKGMSCVKGGNKGDLKARFAP